MDLVEARLQGFDTATRHPWERARLALASRLIARHGGIAPQAVVIDVGCGDTFVVESLARLHPAARFYAVDSAFTPDLIRVFEQRLSVTNVRLFASLDEVPGDAPASLVLLMDVLEHVDDDRALLREMTSRSFFTTATRLLITVPSYAALFCSHDRFLGHYRRYTTRTLDNVLRAVNLTTLDSGHFFATLVPIRVLQVLKERWAGAAPEQAEGLAAWRSSERRAWLLAHVLEWDGRLGLALRRLGVPLPGLSNFAICRTSA